MGGSRDMTISTKELMEKANKIMVMIPAGQGLESRITEIKSKINRIEAIETEQNEIRESWKARGFMIFGPELPRVATLAKEEDGLRAEINKEMMDILIQLADWNTQGITRGEFEKNVGKLQRREKKIEKRKHTASRFYTSELCEELQKRQGVNHMMIEPYAIKEITLKVDGPCGVFVVYD